MESCFMLTDLNNQMSILSKATYRFSAVCIKIPMVCFEEIRQIILKFVWDHTHKKNLEKAQSCRHHAFKLCDRDTVIKAMWCQQNRCLDQWNRIKSPEINPCVYGQFIYDKGAKNIWWRMDSLFHKCCWENWTATSKGWNWTTVLNHT